MKYLISILFLTFISGCSNIGSRVRDCSNLCEKSNVKLFYDETLKCECK